MKYDKTCWSCGKDTMVAVSTWFKCTSCGATWVPQPRLGFPPVIKVDEATGGPVRPGKPTKYRPHKGYTRTQQRRSQRAQG